MRAAFAILATATVISLSGQLISGAVLAAGNPESVNIAPTDGQGPFPAVVALHNCTGLTNRAGTLGARYRDWGERLAKDGFVVLMPDSNASRGVGSQCNRRGAVRPDRERVADANVAR